MCNDSCVKVSHFESYTNFHSEKQDSIFSLDFYALRKFEVTLHASYTGPNDRLIVLPH